MHNIIQVLILLSTDGIQMRNIVPELRVHFMRNRACTSSYLFKANIADGKVGSLAIDAFCNPGVRVKGDQVIAWDALRLLDECNCGRCQCIQPFSFALRELAGHFLCYPVEVQLDNSGFMG